MGLFAYEAKDAAGDTLQGVVDAPSEQVAGEVLQERGLFVLSLTERRRQGGIEINIPFFNRVKSRDVAIFARQLSVMISATVPIVQALRILVRQTESTTLKVIVSEVADDVDGGAKFSSALNRYPQVFGNFFISMIKSGETTGRLDETLNFLADQQEKDYDLQQKIRGALIYPAFILSGIVVVGTIMMIFVVPKLTAIIVESGIKLPLSTRILIASSHFFQKDWWLMALIAIVLIAAFRLFARSEAGRLAIDRMQLRLPIVGTLARKIYITRLARSLSTLLQSGVPLTRALEVTADIVGNTVYRMLVESAIKEVEDGNPLSTTFAQSSAVPAMLSQMMNVGEQTGKLDLILGKLADFFTREVENSVANLVTLIEPLVLVILGVGVGLLVSAVLLPIYDLSGAV